MAGNGRGNQRLTPSRLRAVTHLDAPIIRWRGGAACVGGDCTGAGKLNGVLSTGNCTAVSRGLNFHGSGPEGSSPPTRQDPEGSNGTWWSEVVRQTGALFAGENRQKRWSPAFVLWAGKRGVGRWQLACSLHRSSPQQTKAGSYQLCQLSAVRPRQVCARVKLCRGKVRRGMIADSDKADSCQLSGF